jgi:hypothetical protein
MESDLTDYLRLFSIRSHDSRQMIEKQLYGLEIEVHCRLTMYNIVSITDLVKR